jgi:hypothetical protein
MLAGSPEPLPRIWSLRVREIDSLDCAPLVACYPGLTDLGLSGNLGALVHASSLNRLGMLKRLFIGDLFGMSGADCLLPERVPMLEQLGLHSIPYDYAAAMRVRWRPQIPNGGDQVLAIGMDPHGQLTYTDNGTQVQTAFSYPVAAWSDLSVLLYPSTGTYTLSADNMPVGTGKLAQDSGILDAISVADPSGGAVFAVSDVMVSPACCPC